MNNLQTKIAIVDVDGTLIEGQIQQGLINFLFKKKRIGVVYMIKLNLWFILYKLHLNSNVKYIFEFGLRYLKDRDVKEIDLLVEEYIKEVVEKKIFSRSVELVSKLRADGYNVVLLSTAVDVLIRRVSSIFGADDFLCTRLEIMDGRYTGHILGGIVYGEEKVEIIKQYIQSKSYALSEAVAYADHESDLSLLRIVGKSYIVNPNGHMKSIARREGIAIMDTR
jgi:HAD superfamily hydrolase (TIGR01490 family)